MKKILMILTATIFLAMAVSSVYAYQSHHGKTELIYWDATKAYKGYTIFTPFANNIAYLIDMEGNVVKSWPVPDGFGIEKYTNFLENGNLIRRIKSPSPDIS